ncbi:hypothetical protein COCOBI_19-2310 [Coccomyxa sp. Obi]|nr:hypothetical protein COCOBI_19-2310 [Coccomyxa sp. Obi]
MADIAGEKVTDDGQEQMPAVTNVETFLSSLAEKPAAAALPMSSSWPMSAPMGVQALPTVPQSAATVSTAAGELFQFTAGQSATKKRGPVQLGAGKTAFPSTLKGIPQPTQQEADTAAQQEAPDEQDAGDAQADSPVSSKSYSPSKGPAPAQRRQLHLGVDTEHLRKLVREQQPLRTWRAVTHPHVVPHHLDVLHLVRAYAERDVPQLTDEQRGARLTANQTVQLTWATQKLT